MKQNITILMILLFITNNIQSQTTSKKTIDKDKLIVILTKLVIYNYAFEQTVKRYDTIIPDKYDARRSEYDGGGRCIFPDGEIKDCSLDEFFQTPIGEMMILRRKIHSMRLEMDEIYSHVETTSYDYATELKLKIDKYQKRLNELGYETDKDGWF